jgi:methyl-accepting chemotaxis protein
VAAVERVDSALSQIKVNVGQAHKMVAELTADNQAQASTIGQISSAVLALDSSIQKNAAMVEETSAAARNMAGEIGIVAEQASKFRVKGRQNFSNGAAAALQNRTANDFGRFREIVRA